MKILINGKLAWMSDCRLSRRKLLKRERKKTVPQVSRLTL